MPLADGRSMCPACEPCVFFERFLTLTENFSGKPFILMPWLRKVTRDIFGTLDEDGTRQYKDVYIEVPKKNAKTTWCAGIVVYALYTANMPGTEIYSAATSKDQASALYRRAAQIVRASPMLQKKLRCIPSTKHIIRRDDETSFYSALAADGDTIDGCIPQLVIRDEIHRWRARKALELNQVLERGMITRDNPLVIDITTAGESGESPLGERRHDYAVAVRDGIFEDRRFYGKIFAADLSKYEWDSKEARVAANPSHEDNGGYLKDSVLADFCVKAQNDPVEKAEYLRYHLNVWGQQFERVIDIDAWKAGGDESDAKIDFRNWPTYDVDLAIRKWNLLDRPCFAGIDASWTTDLSSMALLFPPLNWAGEPEEEAEAEETTEGEAEAESVEVDVESLIDSAHEPPADAWTVLNFYWLPEKQMKVRERRDKVTYQKWVDRKFIETTPGNSIDFESIKKKIRWAKEMFELQQVGFDPWNFKTEAASLAGVGVPMVQIDQGFKMLARPTKWFLGAYLDHRIRHGNNPVTNWCASCLSLQGDKKDNVQPAKPERAKSSKRIDGISAQLNGFACALSPQNRPSVYERRGLRSL